MGELSSLKVARFAEILYFVSKNSAFLLSIVGIVQYKFYDCLTLEGLFNNVEIEALRWAQSRPFIYIYLLKTNFSENSYQFIDIPYQHLSSSINFETNYGYFAFCFHIPLCCTDRACILRPLAQGEAIHF